jgi:septin family protein
MGQVKSELSRGLDMDVQQLLPAVPHNLRFRVLIIGRANAGKTSILQRLCDTTETILILECASLDYASSPRADLNEALDMAYSQYRASNTHNAIIEQFSAPPETYSILQFTEFILGNRLQ